MTGGEREERVTDGDVRALGWNSCVTDSPVSNDFVHAQQLHFIGLLLLDIRDRLDVLIDREPTR